VSKFEAEAALLVNRLNGSRLAVNGSSLSDGASVISVRYTDLDKYPQRWTTRKLGEEGGWTVLRIEISDADTTYCLDVGSDDPQVSVSSQAKIAKADGSDRQKWCVREDWRGAELLNFAPYLNTGAGLGLRDDFGHHYYDEAVLVRNFSSTNQLWYWNHNDYSDEIPN
jgi:hypothetical protein